jgi:hypothetical protein
LVSWFLADSGSDWEQSPRAVLPPPPSRDTRSINLMSARGNLALVPSSFLDSLQFVFLSSSSFLGLQFVSWTDNLLRVCVSSCSVSRAVRWWHGCRRGRRSVVSVEARGPLRAYRAAARRRRSATSGGATGRSLLCRGGGTGTDTGTGTGNGGGRA